MDKFKVGDVVQLISGGPKMTVVEVAKAIPAKFGHDYGCRWFASSKLSEHWFRADSLKKVEEDDKG